MVQNDEIKVLIPEEELNSRIRELGEQISHDLDGEPVKLLCVLKGSVFFCCELAKALSVPVYMDFITASSYGDGMESSRKVLIKKEPYEPVEGETVLVVEDIIDSGNTLSVLLPEIKRRGAKKVLCCTLLDKPDRRESYVDVDYTGFQIPDKFVVGFGLDYAQRYRNLPYIGYFE